MQTLKLGKKSYGGTPGHIPNPEVKSVNAESTWGAAPWEDRNLPSQYASLAQLVERSTVNRVVTGSSPVRSAIFRSIAQPGSAPALGAGGHRFKSYCSDHLYAGITQLVERQPSKLNVASSILVSRSK